MMVIGIDVGNKHTGLALVASRMGGKHSDPEDLLDVANVQLPGGDTRHGFITRVFPVIDGWLRLADQRNDRVALYVEEAPAMVHADVNHGAQAAIGFAQGYACGMISGAYANRSVTLIKSSDWRNAMISSAAQWGMWLAPPGRKAPAPPTKGDRFVLARASAEAVSIRWDTCGHTASYANLASLQMAPPAACATCSSEAAAAPPSPEAIRRAWKQTACLFVSRFWPDIYNQTVADARGRARTTKEDVDLYGVADTCEAVGIAIAGLKREEIPF